jgi:3-hydroxyanthranilate 3,4-dioxygenase
MALLASFNLTQWIDENRELLRPPVLNQTLWKATSDFIIMVVGGPNVRTDYHDDPFEEFFYQLKGDIVLEVVDEGKRRDIPIREGSVLLLPAHVRHRPQRPQPDSVGLVVERVRPPDVLDAFEWYCEECVSLLHRREVQVANIVRDLPPVFEEYYGNPDLQLCKSCGFRNPRKPTDPSNLRAGAAMAK